MKAVKGFFKELPTAIGASVWGLCAAMLIFNMLAGSLAHMNGIRFWSYPLFAALKGVTENAEKQRLTLKSFLDGTFQAAYAHAIGYRVPIFEFAVRLRNQVEFSALDASAIPSIVVGAHWELLERVYLEDYCSRDLVAFLPNARIWAQHIHQMQDRVEQSGKTFLYVVTPSKVAQYPEFMPPGMPCASTAADRTGLVPAWIALVRAAGVHVVDTTAVISKAHGRYPFSLYPLDGTHWNGIGAVLAGQAVGDELGRLRDDPGLSSRVFDWHFALEPSGADIDLAVLMNLLWLPDQVPTPEVELHPGPGMSSCISLKVLMVGGSFAHAIGDFLSQERCHPDVVEYEYWHNFVITWEDGDMEERPFNAQDRARDVAQADIIIYEDNEQMLGHSDHGAALYDYITSSDFANSTPKVNP